MIKIDKCFIEGKYSIVFNTELTTIANHESRIHFKVWFEITIEN